MGPGIHVDPTKTRDIAEDLEARYSYGLDTLTAEDRWRRALSSWGEGAEVQPRCVVPGAQALVPARLARVEPFEEQKC